MDYALEPYGMPADSLAERNNHQQHNVNIALDALDRIANGMFPASTTPDDQVAALRRVARAALAQARPALTRRNA